MIFKLLSNIPVYIYAMGNKKPDLGTSSYFSIIIPTYNRKEILTRALNSLIAQTEKDWEAIIVDDGSDDDTLAHISSYLEKDKRIRYLHQEHSGAALAKNKGIAAARGKFLTFLDSDDEYHCIHLESRKAVLIKNTAVRFLYGGIKIVGNHYVPDRFDTDKKIHLDECVIGGTFFIERNLLVSLDGFKNIVIGEDAELFDRLKAVKTIMLKTENPTYVYRHDREDSVTNKIMMDLK
ncbi:MAG TPA: glycosyltransferase family A protein [Bacteroidia bacterium]|jgi:glycosyltransferase involved in cell wall biosynthesis